MGWVILGVMQCMISKIPRLIGGVRVSTTINQGKYETTTDNSYKTAGLITFGMCKIVKHDQGLTFQIDDGDVFPGKIIPSTENRFLYRLSQLGEGYHSRIENGVVRIWVDPDIAGALDFRPWAVSVSAALQPAAVKQS